MYADYTQTFTKTVKSISLYGQLCFTLNFFSLSLISMSAIGTTFSICNLYYCFFICDTIENVIFNYNNSVCRSFITGSIN